MPNGRRRRFSAKQNLSTNERLQPDNCSSNNVNGASENTPMQSNKTNKPKNKFFATGSKQPARLDVVHECESTHDPLVIKPIVSNKEITATSSNIDFYNILNLRNDYQTDLNMDRKRSRKNQVSTGDKKDCSSASKHEKCPRQHRVKVRSPKRRPLNLEESTKESGKITESLDAIDWDQEFEESVMLNIVDNSTDEHLQPIKTNRNNHNNQPTVMANITEENNPFNQFNQTNQDKSKSESQLADQISPTSLKNTINQDCLTHETCPVDRKDSSEIVSADQIDPNIQSSSTSQCEPTDKDTPIDETIPNNQMIKSLQNNPTLLSNPCNENQSSNNSFDAMCRICHGGESLSVELGRMVSACGCRGTVGRVHVKCLERWLTESGKSRCELCGTHYSTRRVHKYGFPKAVAIWVLSHNAKQLMVDSLGIMLMSPLAVVAAWLSGRTLAGLMTPESQQTPWPLASTFVLACMTLVCYYCWIVSAVTRHALGWWIWYRSQYEVHLQLQDNED